MKKKIAVCLLIIISAFSLYGCASSNIISELLKNKSLDSKGIEELDLSGDRVLNGNYMQTVFSAEKGKLYFNDDKKIRVIEKGKIKLYKKTGAYDYYNMHFYNNNFYYLKKNFFDLNTKLMKLDSAKKESTIAEDVDDFYVNQNDGKVYYIKSKYNSEESSKDTESGYDNPTTLFNSDNEKLFEESTPFDVSFESSNFIVTASDNKVRRHNIKSGKSKNLFTTKNLNTDLLIKKNLLTKKEVNTKNYQLHIQSHATSNKIVYFEIALQAGFNSKKEEFRNKASVFYSYNLDTGKITYLNHINTNIEEDFITISPFYTDEGIYLHMLTDEESTNSLYLLNYKQKKIINLTDKFHLFKVSSDDALEIEFITNKYLVATTEAYDEDFEKCIHIYDIRSGKFIKKVFLTNDSSFLF